MVFLIISHLLSMFCLGTKLNILPSLKIKKFEDNSSRLLDMNDTQKPLLQQFDGGLDGVSF